MKRSRRFLWPLPHSHSFLSSSVVKEVARFGGTIDHMVPEVVALDLMTGSLIQLSYRNVDMSDIRLHRSRSA